MRPLTGSDILKVWEQGEQQAAIERALTMLAPACPELTRDELATFSVSRRDAWLFDLRESTFGSQLDGFTVCGECSERLVFTLDLAPLRRRLSTPSADEEFEFETDGVAFRFRLPNSHDLAAVAVYEDVATARRLLAERCVLQTTRNVVERTSACAPAAEVGSTLSEAKIRCLAERIAERAPEAEAQLDFTCPSCGHYWRAFFDIATFFWAEIAAQARRLLREVHLLASAYGWREADILAMSARRREAYLELIS
ncbi:MAG TPA: hypothetical protein VKD91_03925 [Pyrinomonadaceae bacterium]|nr:hypothetical protein [Pyrinomonadaceae bacterium]